MRFVGIACVAAIGLALGYAVLVAPAFEPYLDDQVSYLRLAHGFVTRGEYTRASLDEPFVPEPLRPPGYPLFLAPLCLAGCSHWAVAIVQALLYGALVLLAYGIARAMLSARAAQVAAAGVAGYLPIAYFLYLVHIMRSPHDPDARALFLVCLNFFAHNIRARRVQGRRRLVE